MARIHARVKGKSGSNKPVNADMSFVTMKPKEIEELVVKLAKDDVTLSVIGMTLRDTYGIPDIKKLTGKSVGKIVADANLTTKIPEDLASLVEKALKLTKHLEFNTRDKHNNRGLHLIESKIGRLSKYYKKTGRIASNWSMK